LRYRRVERMADIRIDRFFQHPDVFKQKPEIPRSEPSQDQGFTKIIKGVIQQAVEAEGEANRAIEDFASGSIDDVHDVIMAVNKANLAISLLVQVRNGILEAYHELSRISM